MLCRRPPFDSWVGKIHWRRDRLPTAVFLGFPSGSAGKESACSVGDLSSIPRLGRSTWRRECLPTPLYWPGEFHGLYNPWGCKESDMTEKLSLSLSYIPTLAPGPGPGVSWRAGWLSSLEQCKRGLRQRTLPRRPMSETEVQEQELRAPALNQSFFFLSLNW